MFRSTDLAWPVRTVVIIRDRRSGASQVSNTSDLLHITQTILPRISWHGILDPSRLASPRLASPRLASPASWVSVTHSLVLIPSGVSFVSSSNW